MPEGAGGVRLPSQALPNRPEMGTGTMEKSMQTYTRTVVTFVGPSKHQKVLARLTASKRDAKRLGWRPGVTHSHTIGGTRYTFYDGRN
jgi:hypothetical protein